MFLNINPYWKEEREIKVLELEDEKHILVLHNDDFNTFDFVIRSLIEVCQHTSLQAEQCTWLVHFKGKCEVKTGSIETLKPMCSELLNRGLTAEVV